MVRMLQRAASRHGSRIAAHPLAIVPVMGARKYWSLASRSLSSASCRAAAGDPPQVPSWQ
jgi:hypothetical protein